MHHPTLLTAALAALPATVFAGAATAQDHDHDHASGITLSVQAEHPEHRTITLLAHDAADTVAAPFLGLGCEPIGPELAAHLPVPAGAGLRVHLVEPDSPAAAAGIAEHDVIAKIGDQWLINPEQFAVLVRQHVVGEAVTLTVISAGEMTEVQVTPAERQAPALRPGGYAAATPQPQTHADAFGGTIVPGWHAGPMPHNLHGLHGDVHGGTLGSVILLDEFDNQLQGRRHGFHHGAFIPHMEHEGFTIDLQGLDPAALEAMHAQLAEEAGGELSFHFVEIDPEAQGLNEDDRATLEDLLEQHPELAEHLGELLELVEDDD